MVYSGEKRYTFVQMYDPGIAGSSHSHDPQPVSWVCLIRKKMKKQLQRAIALVFFCFAVLTQAQNYFDKIHKDINKKIDQTSDNHSNKNSTSDSKTKQDSGTPSVQQDQPSTKTYQNYDFVPGDVIVFEDNFADDASGEFPAHWDLVSGQALVSTFKGEKVFALTEGNYVSVVPLLEANDYLTADAFTIEFDFYAQHGAYNNVGLRLWDPRNREQNEAMNDEESAVWFGYESKAHNLSGSYPHGDEEFANNVWHHAAVARRGTQLKMYIDQYRVLTVPVFKGKTYSLNIVGIGDQDKPIMLKNVRVAQGGNFNDIKHLVTETKIITHGILFDVDKATIKPQSMGTLNQICQLMKDHPDFKYEIGGHTDNTGTPEHNKVLSQQRADAVKTHLVSMGIDAGRLTTKGYGDTQPIQDNAAFEGKANNRRVEFIKL
jgi:OmpA-OmpF porin, OOP family